MLLLLRLRYLQSSSMPIRGLKEHKLYEKVVLKVILKTILKLYEKASSSKINF